MLEAFPIVAVRRAEAIAAGDLPPGSLMRQAAGALAGVVVNQLRKQPGKVYGAKVVLLIGGGANGGDALLAGARLRARGVSVLALLTTARVHEEGLAELRVAGGRVIDLSQQPGSALFASDSNLSAEEKLSGYRANGSASRAWACARAALTGADVVVDGILGIGGRPGLAGAAASIVAALDPRVPVIAVDLPSGVHPETGAIAGPHVQATTTVTFGCLKPCHLLPPAAHAVGEVVHVDIGLDHAYLGAPLVERVDASDVAALWPVPRVSDDKYSRGVVGVVAGGALYSGAATLAVGGSVRSGAGMIRYVGPESVNRQVRSHWPEVVPGEGRVQAWVLGPGVDSDSDDDQVKVILGALAGKVPCVVDAGALNVFAAAVEDGQEVTAPVLLTPHAGEAARMLERLSERKRVTRENVETQPAEFARELATLTGATVLLKGSVTIVASPEDKLRSQAEAPAWLATAGAGDVLAGICGTLLASGLVPLEAASIAAWLHGTAATRASGGGPILAHDVLTALPATVRQLLAG